MSDPENRRGRLMPSRRTTRWLFVALPLLIAVVVFGPCVPDVLRNNQHLEELKLALEAVPTPPDTERLVTRTAVGLLIGNSNHCDFFVGSLYRSACTPDSIREHYEARIFLNPISGNEEHVSLNILSNRESWKAVALPPELQTAEAWGISNNLFATGTVFLVTVMRSYEANRDCRCH
jgi:hypothetical protein